AVRADGGCQVVIDAQEMPAYSAEHGTRGAILRSPPRRRMLGRLVACEARIEITAALELQGDHIGFAAVVDASSLLIDRGAEHTGAVPTRVDRCGHGSSDLRMGIRPASGHLNSVL